MRVLPAILVCALACAATAPLRNLPVAAIALSACLAIRHFEIERAWTRFEERFDGFAALIDEIPDGAHVLPVLCNGWGPEHPERAFHSWAMLTKTIYLPDLFMVPGQYLLRSAISCYKHPDLLGVVDVPDDACFDYLWVLNGENCDVRVPVSFELIRREGIASVWRRR